MEKEQVKTSIWSILIGAVLTMAIGFGFGGWVLGSTSDQAGRATARIAVAERLAPICVAQFNLDPEKETKLIEMRKMSSWTLEDYIKKEGWAKMPYEVQTDDMVINKCSELILGNS
jgi:hypothetical protein